MNFQSTTKRTKYRKKIQSSKVQLYRLHKQHTCPYLEKLAKTDFLVLCLYFVCRQCSALHSHCSPSVIEIIFDLFFLRAPALETDDTHETSFLVVILRADCKQMINKAKENKDVRVVYESGIVYRYQGPLPKQWHGQLLTDWKRLLFASMIHAAFSWTLRSRVLVYCSTSRHSKAVDIRISWRSLWATHPRFIEPDFALILVYLIFMKNKFSSVFITKIIFTHVAKMCADRALHFRRALERLFGGVQLVVSLISIESHFRLQWLFDIFPRKLCKINF